MLNTARSELGVVEGPRSNETPYNDWYYGRNVHGASYPWCATFVSWVAYMAGCGDLVPKHAYTPAGAQWFKDRGQWHDTPQVGDIVFFKWRVAGVLRIAHVGIVEGVRPDGSIVSIEGNTDAAGGRTGGKVMRQIRRANIAGYGRPAYLTEEAVWEDDMEFIDKSSSKGMIMLLQRSLKAEGEAAGRESRNLEVDGVWGPGTQKAIDVYCAGRVKGVQPGRLGTGTVTLIARWDPDKP
jgi:surface antigen